MRRFFKITEHTVLVSLIVFSLCNYFFPLLYPQGADTVEFGIPVAFYKAYLAPLPFSVAAENVGVFGGFGLVLDVLFAYLVGCFSVFIEHKFKEGGSQVFQWILRVALVITAILFIMRIFIRGF